MWKILVNTQRISISHKSTNYHEYIFCSAKAITLFPSSDIQQQAINFRIWKQCTNKSKPSDLFVY
jgi:hypothetical protein